MGDYAQYQFEEKAYAYELAKKHGLFRETERLKEQLNEANEVIQKDFDSFDYIHSHIGSNQSNYNALMSATSYAISNIRKYLKKWGVK